ncbi:MAG: cytochrome P450, partial [Chloroflexota bacterium]
GVAAEEGRHVMKSVLRWFTPLISFIPLFQSWWFPPWRQYRRAHDLFSTFVTVRLAERGAQGGDAQDVLGLMMSAHYDDGSSITDDEIRDELLTVLLAGHETTAVALSWAIYEVWRHPDVLQRLRHELDALGPQPDPDLIAKQPYLSAVCDETLRLHTILTEVARLARVPCELFGYTIPPGVGVGVGIWAIHHDPELYPAPYTFRPERFLERSFGPFEFLPFGGGHRRCLGAALSDYQMRLVLAMIATNWDLAIEGEDQDARHNIGMGPKHGVRARVLGRRRAH